MEFHGTSWGEMKSSMEFHGIPNPPKATVEVC